MALAPNLPQLPPVLQRTQGVSENIRCRHDAEDSAVGNYSFKDIGDFRVVGLNVGILAHDAKKGYKTYNLIDTINKLKCMRIEKNK